MLKNLSFIKIAIFINILTTTIIYLDFYIPKEHKIVEQFQSFESKTKKEYGKYGNVNYYTLYYIVCKNKNTYQISELPEFYYIIKKNQKIIITKTYFLDRIKRIQLKQEGVIYIQNLSLLNFLWIHISFLMVLLISFLSFFYSNIVLHILLPCSLIFVFYFLLNHFNLFI